MPPLWGTLIDNGTALKLGSGEIVPAAGAHWLAPVTPGATIFALGLNYGDHAKELGFKKKEPPLIFLKGPTRWSGIWAKRCVRLTETRCTRNASWLPSSASPRGG